MINDYERENISGRQRTSFQRNKNRDITIVSLILESGLRAAEVASLKENDIKWEEKIIIVRRKGGKILVPISLTALTHLKVHYSKLIKESFLNESKPFFTKSKFSCYLLKIDDTTTAPILFSFDISLFSFILWRILIYCAFRFYSIILFFNSGCGRTI